MLLTSSVKSNGTQSMIVTRYISIGFFFPGAKGGVYDPLGSSISSLPPIYSSLSRAIWKEGGTSFFHVPNTHVNNSSICHFLEARKPETLWAEQRTLSSSLLVEVLPTEQKQFYPFSERCDEEKKYPRYVLYWIHIYIYISTIITIVCRIFYSLNLCTFEWCWLFLRIHKCQSFYDWISTK